MNGAIEDEDEYATLYTRLVPYRYPGSKLDQEFSFNIFFVKRLLGLKLLFTNTLAIWMPTYVGYNQFVPQLLDAPMCDMGRTTVSPHLRRQIGIVSGMVSECSYCSAHCCVVGDAFNGPAHTDVKILPNEISENERVALRLTAAVAKIPMTVTQQMRDDVKKVYGEDGFQKIIGVCAFFGFMTVLTDTLGCEVEIEAANRAYELVNNAGWAKATHGTRMSETSKYPTIGQSWVSRFFGKNYITNLIDLGVNITKANYFHGRLMSNFPKSDAALDQWMKKRIGVVISPIKRFTQFGVRQVVAFNFYRYILIEPSEVKLERDKPNIAVADKIILGYVFFNVIGNVYLCMHFARLAKEMGIPASQLNQAMNTAENWSPLGKNEKRPFIDHACMLALLLAKRMRQSVYTLMSDLLKVCDNNAPVTIELVTCFSMFSLLNRTSTALSDTFEEMQLEIETEPVVRDFVESEYWKILGVRKAELPQDDEGVYLLQQVWAGFVKY
ncbi:hypothetical protein HK098_007211 [Nowakowskiella sp. JEL0407]|nr:hypothetical protein HK098_007211 [Nowakowskiella sp. JEL0407]